MNWDQLLTSWCTVQARVFQSPKDLVYVAVVKTDFFFYKNTNADVETACLLWDSKSWNSVNINTVTRRLTQMFESI